MVQLLSAPALLMLLASYSMLSLHSSIFEVLLPHLGHTPSYHGEMGIPCNWLGPLLMAVKVLAAVRIMHSVPKTVAKVGRFPLYRKLSMALPVLFVLVPRIATLVAVNGAMPGFSAAFSTSAILATTVLTGASQVLVLVLVLILSAAPDAASTGTVIGVVFISEMFKALAMGVSGISYYLSDEYSMVAVNGTMWVLLAFIAAVGAAIASRIRETPRVGTDIPAECPKWEGTFDALSESKTEDEHWEEIE